MAEHQLTDEQLMALSDKWAKEPGWCEFERNDFLSCAREIIALASPPVADIANGDQP